MTFETEAFCIIKYSYLIPTLIEDISIKLKPSDFYFFPHRDIYEAMLNFI